MAGPKDSGNSSAEGESRTHAFGPGDVDDGFRVGEFTDPLAAAAARGGEVFAVADDADFGDAALAGLSHGGDCARLGADAFRIGGVLDISARIDRAASRAATNLPPDADLKTLAATIK